LSDFWLEKNRWKYKASPIWRNIKTTKNDKTKAENTTSRSDAIKINTTA